MGEYSRRAWASAESSAWDSLSQSAGGIDLANRDASFGINRTESSAMNDLQIARTAIRESRDFAGKYGDLDQEAVQRIVLSHTTEVLKNQSLGNVPPADATDRYLNEARIRLARLAKYSVAAGKALDLLAAIHLGRNDARRLPSQTALCLRRAALQGQPGNGSLAGQLGMHLAAVGLDNEAQWALEQAMQTDPSTEISQTYSVVSNRANDRDEAIRMVAQMQSRLPAGYKKNHGPVPTVVRISPQQFAATSKPQSAAPTLLAQPQLPAQQSSTQRSVPVSLRQRALGTSATLPSMENTRQQRTQATSTIRRTTAVQDSSQASSLVIPSDYQGDLLDAPASSQARKQKSPMRKMMDKVGNLWQATPKTDAPHSLDH